MTSQESLPRRNRRRIVLVGPAYPYRGGIAQFTDAMSRALRRRGHDVSVITFSRQYPSLLFPGKSQYEHVQGREPEAAECIDSLNPLTWRSTARRIVQSRPDAVVFQYWLPFFAPAYGTIAGRLRKDFGEARIVAVAHNILPHERRPGDISLGRYFLRKCDEIAALSSSVADDARSLGLSSQIHTLSHPVYEHFGEPMKQEEARAQLGLPGDAEILLFFGFVRAYKGLNVLLRAMPAITEALPNAHLVVAGEFYENEAPYRELIRTHQLEARVHLFSEYVPEEEVGVFFSAADVVVQPYVSATQSGVAQTAFHFDRPVIITDVGGLPEVVPHELAGLVVPPNDPDALAAAVIRYFEAGMGERLAEGVRRQKNKYGWDAFLSAVEQMME